MRPARHICAVLALWIGWGAAPARADDISLEQFFELVAVGAVHEVEAALEHQPFLATTYDDNGFSAVHVLDYSGFDQKLGHLQKWGANINAQNDEGHALMHIIIDPEFIPVAAAAGADVNLRDNAGRTPIMVHLLDPDRADFVPALIDAGADVRARDDSGRSVLDYALPHGIPELIHMLTSAGAVE